MKLLVFADVHLKVTPDGEATRKEFVAFLQSLEPDRYDEAIILGDLFDFWFEYRHVVFSGHFDVLRAFADLKDRGLRFRLVCGNHDFWAGRFLEEQLGFTVHREPYACTLDGRRVLFVHGDGVNPSDFGYRIYKRIARSAPAIGLFRLLHPDWAMGLARAVADSSRTYRSPANPAESKEIPSVERFAEGVIGRGEAEIVVCGHTHWPVRKEIRTRQHSGLYINTGDWMHDRHYLEWNGDDFEARRFINDAPLQRGLEAEERTGTRGVPEEISGDKPTESR